MTESHSTKLCRKCGEHKARDMFAKATRNRDGLQRACKACNLAYRRANVDRINAKMREYHQANAERIRAEKRELYWANQEQMIETNRRYREANQEKIRQQQRDNPHIGWASAFRRRTPLANPIIEEFTKADVIAVYGDHCAYCKTGPFGQLDHFMPVKLGGHHRLDNVRPICCKCHSYKNKFDLKQIAEAKADSRHPLFIVEAARIARRERLKRTAV